MFTILLSRRATARYVAGDITREEYRQLMIEPPVGRNEKLTPSCQNEERWMTNEISGHPALSRTMQGGEMLQADEVVAMLRLHALGWGAKRLSKEFGCARNTVRRYLRKVEPLLSRSLFGVVRLTGWTIGYGSAFSVMMAMRM